jgi:hypothetical protein
MLVINRLDFHFIFLKKAVAFLNCNEYFVLSHLLQLKNSHHA